MTLASLIGPKRSLKRNLIFSLSAAMVACVLMAIAALLIEFEAHRLETRQAGLEAEARDVASHLGLANGSLTHAHAEHRFDDDDAAPFAYAVYDRNGNPVIGGGALVALELDDDWDDLEETAHFVGADGRPAVAMPIDVDDDYVVVASLGAGHPDLAADLLLFEFAEDLGGLAVVAAILILATALFVVHRSLKSVLAISNEVDGIGPSEPDQRLSVGGAPTEIRPLIGAVNGALDRLEAGFKAQRDFAANAAHEVRTPIAVLRSRIDRLEDLDAKDELANDVGQLERIFEQLLELSRTDAIAGTHHEILDLRETATDLAAEMALQAIEQGKSLAVSGAEEVKVRGHPGLLRLALRNLVENALIHTPEGTEVDIDVTSSPPGWRVLDRGPGIADDQKATLFERFRRGNGANIGPAGAGLGLSIVKRTVDVHGGQVWIEDRDGGGAAFVIALPDRE
ncbi:MAG: sensor histidine kinase [Geminicoccaceae bacterium]